MFSNRTIIYHSYDRGESYEITSIRTIIVGVRSVMICTITIVEFGFYCTMLGGLYDRSGSYESSRIRMILCPLEICWKSSSCTAHRKERVLEGRTISPRTVRCYIESHRRDQEGSGRSQVMGERSRKGPIPGFKNC